MDRLVRTPGSLLSFLTVGLFVNHAVPPLPVGADNVGLLYGVGVRSKFR